MVKKPMGDNFMKSITKFIVVLLLAFAISTIAFGQESVSIDPEFSGVVSFEVSGTIEDNVLTVENFTETVDWVIISPDFDGVEQSGVNFIGDWNVENTPISGVIVLEGRTLQVEMTVASYDSLTNVASFNIEVVKAITAEEVKDADVLPASFEDVKISLKIDTTVMTSLQNGYLERIDSARAQQIQCNPAVRPC
jgi:hypothetical protein